jgi:hypothetical protein
MEVGLKFLSSYFAIFPVGLPLKIIIGVKKIPAAVTVSAPVALFVPLDILHT